jgi:hypothetical protein
MPTATAIEWMDATEFAEVPTPSDLQEFFGIPPSPPDDLGANIRAKRKYWKKKEQKARSDDALNYAGAVLQAIADAEDALTRGAAATGGGEGEFQPRASDRAPMSIDDVLRELERLLFRGRYRDALDRVQRYQERWHEYPRFTDMRSVVILEAAQNVPGIVLDPRVLQSAIGGAYQVLHQIGPTEAGYLTLIELLEIAGRAAEIPEVFAEAGRRLPQISAAFRVRELAIRFKSEPWNPLLRYCIELVRQSGDDRALRSELVQMIIGRASAELLPLNSAEAVRAYQTVVAAAAWIADGVPEAEDFVRTHRMWASNADQPVFGGNWQWRAFFGLITLFIALPLLNSSMAKPAWQVLMAGPSLAETSKTSKRKGAVSAQNRAWFLVTLNAYIEPVHEKCKLPWQERPGQWPEVDASKLFNF